MYRFIYLIKIFFLIQYYLILLKLRLVYYKEACDWFHSGTLQKVMGFYNLMNLFCQEFLMGFCSV